MIVQILLFIRIGKISPQYAHIRPLAFKCTFNNIMFIDMNSDEHSNDDRKNNTAKILDVIDHWLKSTKSASKKLVIQKIINVICLDQTTYNRASSLLLEYNLSKQ